MADRMRAISLMGGVPEGDGIHSAGVYCPALPTARARRPIPQRLAAEGGARSPMAPGRASGSPPVRVLKGSALPGYVTDQDLVVVHPETTMTVATSWSDPLLQLLDLETRFLLTVAGRRGRALAAGLHGLFGLARFHD